ncbi:MAG: efflux RND transporter periplasmic adaptor subunit, partial [Planctomycetes bacterium]|nr:efflux RND transporter periplasmic adaptor subunit [Planctomycetota bacterium]
GGELPAGVLARVQLSPYRIAQGGVRTAAVEARPLVREVASVGFIEVDERREKRIAARVAGRVDGVSVDFTGLKVVEGDPLLSLYSPELLSTQEALLSSARLLAAVEKSGSGGGDLERARRVLDASRERLLQWGLGPDQVDAVLTSGETRNHVTVRSPLSGTVLEKKVQIGQYVMEGADLYRIADLSKVWVRARIFPADLPLARIGAPVEAVAEGFPGETFRGTVVFVDAVVDPATRTVGVRMDLDNPGGRLLPGMYVTARIRVPVAELEPFASRAVPPVASAPAPDAAYWTCTMHPEVVATGPGRCPKCAMDLVEKAMGAGETIQWWCPMHPEVTADHAGEKCSKCGGMDLVPRILAVRPAGSVPAVPEPAVIDTGTRKVVYRESSPGVFDAVEVVLGPRADGWYPVIAGVAVGDRVVAAGAFLVDAETRLNPSAAAAYFGASGSPSAAPGHEKGK